MTTGRYLPLLQQLDRWQDAAKQRHPDLIPCRAGCAACCHGPFDISVADAAALIDGVGGLAPDVRTGILERARTQIAAMLALEPEWAPPFDIADIGDRRFDAVSEALAHLRCPLLDETDSCLAYSHRPMVCRIMGLGMAVASGDTIENGCPIQGDFPAYQELPPEPFDLETWEASEDREKAVAAVTLFGDPARTGFETTIAGAIILGNRE